MFAAKVALAHPVLRDTCTSLCNGRSYNSGLRWIIVGASLLANLRWTFAFIRFTHCPGTCRCREAQGKDCFLQSICISSIPGGQMCESGLRHHPGSLMQYTG